ncbi:short tail fibers protein [Klebsiella phage CPRSA]|nr:short tail fibers protein [Klebsiella phage CPRSA]
MSNNTINHVSDKSIYVTFDPTGTDWPDTITNVQDALEKIGSWARTDTGLPIATTSVRGIAQSQPKLILTLARITLRLLLRNC